MSETKRARSETDDSSSDDNASQTSARSVDSVSSRDRRRRRRSKWGYAAPDVWELVTQMAGGPTMSIEDLEAIGDTLTGMPPEPPLTAFVTNATLSPPRPPATLPKPRSEF
eukprot:PhM_4_TR5527/c0_g1_i2/m.48927